MLISNRIFPIHHHMPLKNFKINKRNDESNRLERSNHLRISEMGADVFSSKTTIIISKMQFYINETTNNYTTIVWISDEQLQIL